MTFRWDQWLKGALASGFVAVVAIAPGIIKDGVTGTEAWALLAAFVGGIGLYCSSHPPKLE